MPEIKTELLFKIVFELLPPFDLGESMVAGASFARWAGPSRDRG